MNNTISNNTSNRAEYVETSLLAKLFTDDVKVVLVRVFSEDFSDTNNKKFFQLCRDHYFQYGQLNPSILKDRAKMGNIFDYGSIELIIKEASTELTDALIKELKDFARKRNQADVFNEARLKAVDPVVSSREITAMIYSKTREWSDELESKTHTLSEVKQEILSGDIGKRLEIGNTDLDDLFEHVGSHYRTTEVCVAYEKHGKTTYACMRSAMYLRMGYKGAYFTFEGGREDIYDSIKPYIQESDDFYIIDDCQTLDKTIAKIWELKIRHNIDFVVIDYLQRIQVDNLPMHRELERIVTISPALTDICKRENLFGLFLAQPRKPDGRLDGWKGFPSAEEIYGSGQIAKDAYIITGLFRPYFAKNLVVYNEMRNLFGVRMYDNSIAPINTVVLRVLKQRKGIVKTNTVWMKHTDEGLKVQKDTFMGGVEWKRAE